MKRIFAILTALLLTLSLAACGDKSSDDGKIKVPPPKSQQNEPSGGQDSAPSTLQPDGPSEGKKWPETDYAPAGIAYDKGGKIVVVSHLNTEDLGMTEEELAENGMDGTEKTCSIYIYGATKSDFDAYAAKLGDAGLTGEVFDYGEDAFGYDYSAAGFFLNMDFSDKIKTTTDTVDGEFVDVEYNLVINIGN